MRYLLLTIIFSFGDIAHSSDTPDSNKSAEFEAAYEKTCFAAAEYVQTFAIKRDEGVSEKTMVKFLTNAIEKNENPTQKKILKDILPMVKLIYKERVSQADAFLGTFKRCMNDRKKDGNGK